MGEKELEKIIEFYEKYLGKGKITKEGILAHIKFATVDYAIDDNGEVIGLCRWNISEDGKVAKIISLAIAPEWRHNGIGKHFLVRGLKIWKNVTHLEFERGLRGDKRRKQIPIEFILRHNNF